MVNLAYNPNRILPTAEELPSSDDTPVDNQLQNDIPNLLLSLLAFIWANRDDWYFGVDMGVYYNPDEPAIVPDGFLAVGVKHDTGEKGRLSYLRWAENNIMPILALEVVSERYNSEYEEKLEDYQKLGILYYAIYNPLTGRKGRFKNRQRLEVYRLIEEKYELLPSENNRVWLPEIELALGYEHGEHIAWKREWLYWYDESGNRYLTANERAMNAEAIAHQERLIATQERLAKQEAEAIAHQERLIAAQERLAKQEAEAIAAQERLAKQAAEEKAQRLAERLRALGINPDEM
jgi:Uma2 family endonuclease